MSFDTNAKNADSFLLSVAVFLHAIASDFFDVSSLEQHNLSYHAM